MKMFPKMVATLFSRTLISKTFLKLNATRFLVSDASINWTFNDQDTLHLQHRCKTDHQILKVLLMHRFNVEGIKLVLEHIDKRRENIPNLNAKLINESIIYWGMKLRTEINDNESGISNDIQRVLTNVEPDLLFVSQSEMDKRIDEIMKIGFLTGRQDFLRVFNEAPRGYLLQDWSQIRKKFYYFQYVIMEWWLKGSKDRYPTPHPLIKDPKIIECSYEHMKARFLFSVYTGLKSPTVLATLKQKSVDFRTLLLSDVENYLKKVAPHCTPEEYSVFEEIVSEMNDKEDEILDDLAELGAVAHDNNHESKPKSKRKRKRRE